jgi:DNA-binding response OmpR family regulator
VSLFSTVADFLKPAPPPDPALHQALARVAELVDPLLKLAPGFERQLAGPLQHALGYCDGLVAALPGPVDINRQAFANDPLVHALFATADDIDQMLGRSQAVRDYLTEPCSWDSDYFYAMFAARRQQKKQLGMARQGDLIRNDVPQLVLYFSGQTLIEPNCQLDATRHGLRCKALESLLHTFRTHVEALRHEREGLRADLSVERAHLTVLRGSSGGREYEVSTRHLAELSNRLRHSAESLQPEHLLGALADYLQAPEPALHLTPVSITVDRLGVVREQADHELDAQTLNFPELTARDRRLHLAMLARISRDEAIEAVEMVRDQQHRFMLI